MTLEDTQEIIKLNLFRLKTLMYQQKDPVAFEALGRIYLGLKEALTPELQASLIEPTLPNLNL